MKTDEAQKIVTKYFEDGGKVYQVLGVEEVLYQANQEDAENFAQTVEVEGARSVEDKYVERGLGYFINGDFPVGGFHGFSSQLAQAFFQLLIQARSTPLGEQTEQTVSMQSTTATDEAEGQGNE